jgi:hypothetical protein
MEYFPLRVKNQLPLAVELKYTSYYLETKERVAFRFALKDRCGALIACAVG